jgi:hypothetical protein
VPSTLHGVEKLGLELVGVGERLAAMDFPAVEPDPVVASISALQAQLATFRGDNADGALGPMTSDHPHRVLLGHTLTL